MKHLEQQILDLITDEVFAKRLANELFIAMQKNDIYEQVKFESRESIEANIERLEKELETEGKKLDIVIPQAKAFNELQKDVDKALDDINQEKYRAHHSLVVSRLKLQDKDENYINKLIYDNMTFSELDDLIKDKPVPLSNEILYRWAMASIPLDVLNDVINRIQKRMPETVSLPEYGDAFKSNLNLKERYALFLEALGLNRVPTYIIDKVIVDNMMGKELVDVVNSLPLRNSIEVSNSDIVACIDMELFQDILQRIYKNEADLKFLAENDTAIDYFDGKGSNAIGLGKSEAERKETLRERAKKAWEKYRNK